MALFPIPFDDIEITSDGGSYLLMLYCGPRRFGASATKIYPSLHNLLLCASDLSGGRDTVACRWIAEPGGFFLDFTQMGKFLHLAVHEMDLIPEGMPEWTAVRGHSFVSVTTETKYFLSKLCMTLRKLERFEAERPRSRLATPIDLSTIEAIERAIDASS